MIMIKNGVSGLVIFFILRSTVCIPLGEFYPFGDGISLRVPPGDDTSSPPISLQMGFRFFNQAYTTLYVSYHDKYAK